MDSTHIDAATKLGMVLGGLPGRVAGDSKRSEVEKRIRNMLYPVRNAQNATSLMKAIAEAQRGVDKLSDHLQFFPIPRKDDSKEKPEKPQKEHLWVKAELMAYLAGSDCEWEKVKHLIVVAAYNMLNPYVLEDKKS